MKLLFIYVTCFLKHGYMKCVQPFSLPLHLQSDPELMIQALRVGTGHCSNHILYRIVWV